MEFMGQSGFFWWFGVVEDINDPLKLGRVRVRVIGYHTEDKKLLPISDLPWAHPLQDITSASVSGIGRSPTGLVLGSHVFGFFRDGPNAQQPVVMFSVGGIPTELAKKNQGFNDPSGTFPLEVDVPDTNRLATGDETEKTIVERKKQSLTKDVLVAWDTLDLEKWSEPETPYKTKYPNNKVFSTLSGMVEEWDDTPDKERHHTVHPSGSFEEVANGWEKDPAGTRVHKVVGNNYEIIAGDDFVNISGTARITINGSAKVFIGADPLGGDLSIQVDRDANLLVRGNMRSIVEKDHDVTVYGDSTERVLGNKYTYVLGNHVTETETGSIVSASGRDAVLKTKTGSDVFVAGLGARSIKLNSRGLGAGDPFIPVDKKVIP
jgi:hypothetical protein